MYKFILSLLLFSILIIFSSASFAQDYKDINVVLINTYKMKDVMGDDAQAFRDMLKQQGEVFNKDSRVIRSYVLRHFWGSDSRDLIVVMEFKNYEDLFSFSNEMDSMVEKAFSKEQLNAYNELWNKYVGQHSDEIYQIIPDTKK